MGLGSKFVPVPEKPTSRKEVLTAFERLHRTLDCKIFFAGREENLDYDPKSKLYLKSNFRPFEVPTSVDTRLNRFKDELRRLFYRNKARSNFTFFQSKLFKKLIAADSVVFAQADKGLDPVAVTLDQYIRDGLIHLNDQETYEIISEALALQESKNLKIEILKWATKFSRSLSKQHRAFIIQKLEDTEADPFGYFYLLYKLHKNPIKTRPVCSDCASLPHALGMWVDEMLQPMVKAQHTYFKDSYTLKLELNKLVIPKNSTIFSFDAVSMYSKIDTEDCISRLTTFLLQPATQARFKHYNAEALIKAIKLVMRNNRMRFGDIIVKQLVGIAMGMSCAPALANLYVAIHEQAHLLKFLSSSILYLKRFIDDGLAIWLHHPDPVTDAANWKEFKTALTSGGLGWTFTNRGPSVEFMDMTIRIEGPRITTTLFEKPLALHLYIPPHSCHAPGVTASTVMGKVLRIYQLCSCKADIEQKLCTFYKQMLDRGFDYRYLTFLFNKAITSAEKYCQQSELTRQRLQASNIEAAKRRVYLHLPYHPANPSSKELQSLWHRTVFNPEDKPPLNQIKNNLGARLPVDRMVIAYSRAPNIGNLLSYRKICKRSGPKVSSYLTRH